MKNFKNIISFLIANILFINLIFAIDIKEKPIVVGSKIFTESYIIAEIFSQLLEENGHQVDRKFGLGATGIAFEALKSGKIDILPEYTGTISEAILKINRSDIETLNKNLLKYNLIISQSLGFNNTYVFGAKKSTLETFNIKNMSDLVKHEDLRYGIDHEFLKRKDGLEKLKIFYNIKTKNLSPVDHSLAYEALNSGDVDIINLYSTDAKIKKFGIKKIIDDKNFFPEYKSVIFASKEWTENNSDAWQSLLKLVDKISEQEVIQMNSRVEIDKLTFSEAAREFLLVKNLININKNPKPTVAKSRVQTIHKFLKLTYEHIGLVFLSVFLAMIFGIFLGIVCYYQLRVRKAVLSIVSIIQTIPALALLCFLIPLFGIGVFPALVALFLYALLPIVQNTYTGFSNIPKVYKESAYILSLTTYEQIRYILLPMSFSSIIAGIKTSAVINVGTATLASFIGAGGYGTLIVTGLALNDSYVMLQGAIPAAILALVVNYCFRSLEKKFTFK